MSRNKIINLTIFCVVAILLLFGFEKIGTVFDMIMDVAMPFFIGAVLAVILNIPTTFFEKRVFKKQWKRCETWKRPLSVLIVVAISICIIAGVCLIIIPNVTSTIGEITIKVPPFAREIAIFVKKRRHSP